MTNFDNKAKGVVKDLIITVYNDSIQKHTLKVK